MIACKTEAGLRVLRDRSIPLSPRQRSAFILFDGRRSVGEVLAATASIGVTGEDIAQLFDAGLLAAGGGASPCTASSEEVGAADEPGEGQQRYQRAYPIATRLTAGLGLRGFRLNLAIEAAGSYEKLRALAPQIRDLVGADRCLELDRALNS